MKEMNFTEISNRIVPGGWKWSLSGETTEVNKNRIVEK